MRFVAMSLRFSTLAISVLALSACGQDRQPDAAAAPSASAVQPEAQPVTTTDPALPPPEHVGPEPSATPTAPDPAAIALTLREWRRSENPKECAPLAFKQTGDQSARVRRAEFSGGWGIAYDTPETRSAYGVAGPGVLELDNQGPAEQRARLARQWPLFRELEQFPRPSFAGYGVEGAGAYPKDNPDGRGLNSVAYVRIKGQKCTYNLWSRLGRAHLEFLMENLVKIGT